MTEGDMEWADESQGEELSTQRDRIAESMATLAAAETAPTGVAVLADQFEASDVSFEGIDWLVKLHRIQGWLYLDADFPPITSPLAAESACRKLFDLLGVAGITPSFHTVGNLPVLTLEGAEELARRLDQAVAHQQVFLEACEDNSTRHATKLWEEAWGEEVPVTEQLDSIQAKTLSWPIVNFAENARKGRLNLSPSYQRGDVWSTDQCQKLVISILRGIPLPSVILLKPETEKYTGHYEVVDGKQRLSSILRFMGRHPRAMSKVREVAQLRPDLDLVQTFEGDYRRFRKLWNLHFGEKLTSRLEAEYFFPFRLPGPKDNTTSPVGGVLGKYYCEIGDTELIVGGERSTVEEIFESPASPYQLPLIEYSKATPRQIHEVFHLYNRQGKHLNAEEIRNALFHEVRLMKLLMVCSGDNDDASILAPYLSVEDVESVRGMAATLTGYRFGVSRYRRTKLLSWMVALALHPSLQAGGGVAVKSTAKHIDNMLETIRDAERAKSSPPLGSTTVLQQLSRDLGQTLALHSSLDGEAWHPRFKDDKSGAKWQELQLVASLVAVFLLVATYDDASTRLDDSIDRVRQLTAESRRPGKTQNSTQWAFIATFVTSFLGVLGVDATHVHSTVSGRYGSSGLPTMLAALSLPRE